MLNNLASGRHAARLEISCGRIDGGSPERTAVALRGIRTVRSRHATNASTATADDAPMLNASGAP